jgi:Skp family chaperone for outer membrane proteins
MKKIIFFLVFSLGFGIHAFAQQHEDQKSQKIQALYIAYITRELQLTETEAQKFWPLHNQFDSELKSIHQNNLPELESEEASLKVKKSYRDRFAKIIGPNRTDDFFKKDAEFRKKLIERLKERQERKGDNRPNKRNHPWR